MSARGEVSRISEHPVGAPYDEVSRAGGDSTAATGAGVDLDGLLRGDRLHGPLSAAALLRPLPAREQAIERRVSVRRRPAPA